MVALQGERFAFPNGREAFIERFAQRFPSQRENLERYCDLVEQVASLSPFRDLQHTVDESRFINDKLLYQSLSEVIDQTITDLQAKLAKTEKESEELNYLFNRLRALSQVTELDPTLVNTLIKRIEVHNREERDGKNYVKVDIYFTAIGMFDIPSEKEINEVMRRMNSEIKTA